MKTNINKKITAEEFDEKFTAGEDVIEYLDLENARVTVSLLLPVILKRNLLQIAKSQNKTLEELILDSLQKVVNSQEQKD